MARREDIRLRGDVSVAPTEEMRSTLGDEVSHRAERKVADVMMVLERHKSDVAEAIRSDTAAALAAGILCRATFEPDEVGTGFVAVLTLEAAGDDVDVPARAGAHETRVAETIRAWLNERFARHGHWLAHVSVTEDRGGQERVGMVTRPSRNRRIVRTLVVLLIAAAVGTYLFFFLAAGD